MASIPVVLNGTFTTDTGSAVGVFQGTMAYSDRGPGGGPIVPPSDAHPEHPIYNPPSIWPDPGRPHPEHPIYYPEPPPEGPPPEGPVGADGFIKSPPPGGGWGYHPQYAWMYDPAAGTAEPKG